MNDVWAAVPVKAFTGAKQRLAALLSSDQRRVLARAMLEDVLVALSSSRLAGILVNTIDPEASALAQRYGARVVTDGAEDGHTGAVAGLMRALKQECQPAMLTLPGDVPRVTAAEINALIALRRGARGVVIAPAHDELGSNAVLCTPPDVMPLRFGDDSYFPHLITARRYDLEPVVARMPGLGLDIDHPADLRAFLSARPRIPTRTLTLLEGAGV